MEIIDQAQALHIVGIELRTSNAEAARTIPAFWQRFQLLTKHLRTAPTTG